MNLTPFPYINNLDDIPVNGCVFKLPKFCNQKYNQHCKDHYKKIHNTTGLHKCPYGFVSNVIKINENIRITTGLNIKKHSDRKKMVSRIHKNELVPKLSISEFNEIINTFGKYEGLYYSIKNSQNALEGSKSSVQSSKELINVTFHELRKLNKQLKRQAEQLQNEVDKFNFNYDYVVARTKNIFSTSQLITTRLNTYDFHVNPHLISSGKKIQSGVYKKFEKAAHCLKLSAADKNIKIKLVGTSFNQINAFDEFELLPFLLFDNAIKYSIPDSTIVCKFENFTKEFIIEVVNTGPKPLPEEKGLLFEKGFRSKNVIDIEQGSGIGLYLVKYLCDLHHIAIDINYENNLETIDGKLYSEFKVTLKFDDFYSS